MSVAGHFKTKPNVSILRRLGFTDLFDKDAAAKYGGGFEEGKSGLTDDGVLYNRQGQYIGRLDGGADGSFYRKLLKNKDVQEAAHDAGFDKLTKGNVASVFVNRYLQGS